MSKCLRMNVYKRQKFRKIVPAKVGWRQSFKLDLALAQYISIFEKKKKKVDTPKIGHFREGLLSSLLAHKPSKWLKMHFTSHKGEKNFVILSSLFLKNAYVLS